MAEKSPTREEITRRQKKTVSVRKLAEQIRGLRQKVTNDMKSDDEKTRLTAAAVALMDCTAERVGNDESAENGHVGVTGFQRKHVSVDGNKVLLKYVGKSGVDHDKSFTNERIAAVLKECLKRCKSPDDYVLTTSDGFKVKADRVNRYLREYGVTAKDIRGYAANHMTIEALKGRQVPKEERERKKVMSEVLTDVAEKVGHGKPTLRKHYLLPNLEDDYVKHGKIPSIKDAAMRLSSNRVADFFYTNIIVMRVAGQTTLWCMLADLIKLVKRLYAELFDEQSELPDRIVLKVTDDIKEGKIGAYNFDGELPYGEMKIARKAFRLGLRYVYWVMAHELVHAALGDEADSNEHGDRFQELATRLGIPEGYQD